MEYFLDLIPNLSERIQQLDERINEILVKMLTEEQRKMSVWELKKKYKEIYDNVIASVESLIKEFYLSLSTEIIRFQTEFVPLFILNYKALIDSFMIPDMFTLHRYQNFVSDKKADNFMVKTEPYVENTTHVNVKLGSTNITIRNLCSWHNCQEYCFLYPVDFDSCNLENPPLESDLLTLFLNIWMYSFSRIYLYSDNNSNNFESGNILCLSQNMIKFNFSKFGSRNNISDLFLDIFTKYNPFKIILFNPLNLYYEGMQSMVDDSKFTNLNKKKNASDFRFMEVGKIIYENINIENAFNILGILLNGNTVIYDTYNHRYREYSSSLNFNNANGLPTVEPTRNVYKTFTII